jgi:tetratricopeptide (TPR) repeat protein
VLSGSGHLGHEDNSVHVWETATGRLIRRFEGHHSCVSSVAFSPDGLLVASGAGDSTILLWDKFAPANNNLGIALQDKDRVDEAIAEYQKAIQLDPKYAVPHLSLGNALRDKGRVDEAIAEYQKAIQVSCRIQWCRKAL